MIPVTPADACEQLDRLGDKPEAAHQKADEIVLGVLVYFGQTQLVKAYLNASERTWGAPKAQGLIAQAGVRPSGNVFTP